MAETADPMSRKPTLYVVERAEDKIWRPIAKLKARDPLSAVKAAADDDQELYRAIPARYITEATGAGERFPSLTLTN